MWEDHLVGVSRGHIGARNWISVPCFRREEVLVKERGLDGVASRRRQGRQQ